MKILKALGLTVLEGIAYLVGMFIVGIFAFISITAISWVLGWIMRIFGVHFNTTGDLTFAGFLAFGVISFVFIIVGAIVEKVKEKLKEM